MSEASDKEEDFELRAAIHVTSFVKLTGQHGNPKRAERYAQIKTDYCHCSECGFQTFPADGGEDTSVVG